MLVAMTELTYTIEHSDALWDEGPAEVLLPTPWIPASATERGA